jgi:hypothetical protein
MVTRGDAPLSFQEAASTTFGDYLFLYGGKKSALLEMGHWYDKLYRLDYGKFYFWASANFSVSNKWKILKTKGTILPPKIVGHSMVTVENTVYIFGGKNNFTANGFFTFNATESIVSDTVEWKLESLNTMEAKTWSLWSKNTLFSRYNQSVFTIDGKIFIYGGLDPSDNVLNDLICYDPSINIMRLCLLFKKLIIWWN